MTHALCEATPSSIDHCNRIDFDQAARIGSKPHHLHGRRRRLGIAKILGPNAIERVLIGQVGDEAVCREAKEILGDSLTTVAVKRGLSRYSARNFPLVKARQMIEEGAYKALQDLKAVKPYVPAKPTRIKVELSSADKAADFMGRHGVTIVNPTEVVSDGEDWMQAWDQVWHW